MSTVLQSVNQASDSLRSNSAQTHGRPDDPKQLGKQDFLNLMMVQMANQDPLDPMKSEQMMQQMAALGTVEQLQNANAKLTNLLAIQGDIARSSAYSFLDKDVQIGSNTLKMMGGNDATAAYSLSGDAEKVLVQVVDAEGNPIRLIDQGAQKNGTHTFTWNGRDDDGDPVANGTYQYRVIANDADGEKISVNQFQRGRVTGVEFMNGRPMVKVNNDIFPLDKISGVNNVSEKRYDQASPLPLRTELKAKPAILQPKPLAINPASTNSDG